MKARIALWENMRCRMQTLFNIYKWRIYTLYKLSGNYLRRAVEDGLKLAEVVRNKAGTIDLEKAVHVEFPRTYYITKAFLPRTLMLMKQDTHIGYLSRYIRDPYAH